jgi:hypothetical protein
MFLPLENALEALPSLLRGCLCLRQMPPDCPLVDKIRKAPYRIGFRGFLVFRHIDKL